MNRSETISNLASSLVKFQSTVGKIKKEANNPFFKSSYASLPNVLDSIREPLAANNLSFVQFPSGAHGLTTVLMHGSGEFISDTYEMRPAKDDPQGRGSAITYQRRYALASILGLSIDDDDDGNTASGNQSTDVVADAKPWLNMATPQFKAVVARLKDGTTTIDEVRRHYKINKEVQAELQAIKNE